MQAFFLIFFYFFRLLSKLTRHRGLALRITVTRLQCKVHRLSFILWLLKIIALTLCLNFFLPIIAYHNFLFLLIIIYALILILTLWRSTNHSANWISHLRKTFFIFCHYISFCIFRIMKIICNIIHNPSCLFNLLH